MEIPPMTWEALEPGMRTGDLILFSGTSAESEWIKALTLGEFSHAAMIYRPDPTQAPLLWQEAPEGIVTDPWVTPPAVHAGAQLGDALAATQLITYTYKDAPFYVALDWERPDTLNDLMADVLTTYEDRPFGTILEMVLHYLMGHFRNASSGDATLYCAQLVAVTYMRIGLLSDERPANYYAPSSFDPSSETLSWATGVQASLAVPTPIIVPDPKVAIAAVSAERVARWPAGPLAPERLAPPKGH